MPNATAKMTDMDKKKPDLNTMENETAEALAEEVFYGSGKKVQILSYVCVMEVMDENGKIYPYTTWDHSSPSYKVMGLIEWVRSRLHAMVAFGDDDEESDE